MVNLIKRVLSGVIYIALIVAAILLLDNSPVMYLLVFPLLIVLGIGEMISMAKDDATQSWLVNIIDMLGGIGVFVALYLHYESTTMQSRSLWLLPIAAYLLLRTIVQLYRPRQNAVHSLERSFFSLGYVALPIAMLNGIMSITAPRLLLGMFIFIWLYDTGAYCVGMLLGRHRLFERISPKKSWEGVIGGVAFCVAGAYATHHWFNEFFQVPDLTVWVGMSVVVAVFATFGDLVESLIKRTVGVKDSGNLLPGHGGILDRIDSLLLVAPAVFIYLLLVVPNYL
ncbi:MAG: phosphatidate cytidylyltransferase [Muribaculaceae bacterium]|jgi:phosphatidate cytidylyltransferase|nr:phosphatidate cytidylyltransferase [Bacteroidales bacterium]MBQ1486521.1 phosphatidate cytidylyltransferase [Muribaculaceae bacterium]MBQ1585533.1 phosphatidate cytidylyltransferase [Muribaculaceae bacterium]MBQ1746804.1 phosphatidate cytidylyltransferase [Muribaculaceae bacterium]